MKKALNSFFILILLLLILIISILATTGIETNKFNQIISDKINENNKAVSIELKKIKFKIDIKNLSLFLNTDDPKLKYENQILPIKNIKVYLDFTSLFQSKPNIEKISLDSNEISIEQLKKILIKSKPSNFNSFILNNVNKGIIKTNLELYLDDNFKIKNYIAKGEGYKIKVKINKNLKFENTKFNFFADQSDILVKNISSKSKGLTINDGNIQLEKNENIRIRSNFTTEINLNKTNSENYLFLLKKINYNPNHNIFKAKLNHNLEFIFDKTFKVINYDYRNNGKVDEFVYKLNKNFNPQIFDNEISLIKIKNSNLNFGYNSEKTNTFQTSGLYQVNDKDDFNNYKIETSFSDKSLTSDLEIEISEILNLEIINYRKTKGKKANINLKFKKKNNDLYFDQIKYQEENNLILINDLRFLNNSFISLKNLKVKTFNQDKLNNDFSVNFSKIINVQGKKFDAENLNKLIKKKSNNKFLEKISKDIKIEIVEIKTPLSKQLGNFRLIGSLKKGEFTKVSSKGDFGNDKFLDITLKTDKDNKKKFLEIYSDLPQPLLSEYSFFKGLSGGNIMFSSIIEGKTADSKLIIEDFKIVNAPAVVKLLSLADFGGLADLAEGEGLSFQKMEIVMSSDENFLKLEELYAVGPSISVLMDGYKDANNITSLRGTLVPAKNLNKLLSKIPVIGNIIIPKETGEGLFGVSFKMKGPPGKIKTTINPLKTLTPRFITKALEKVKGAK